MSGRFTLDGSQELETHLAATCETIAGAVKNFVPAPKIQGLLLGGGYGRGEGGVLKTSAGDQPYNDLEFFLFLQGINYLNEKKYGTGLHALGEELSQKAGLEVEFKILSQAKLRRSSVTMFYYDLVSAHRFVLGEESLLAGCDHHRKAGNIPLHEATRLLMNRCSGLLFASEKLLHVPFTPKDADFVGRNLAKAHLAFGDVLLAALGQYHWSCLERSRRMQELSSIPDFDFLNPLKALHRSGVEFKLHPVKRSETPEVFGKELAALKQLAGRLWLWLECRRLERRFSSMEEYALDGGNKCPETSQTKNRLINLRSFGAAPLTRKNLARYPRERLLNVLPILLWSSDPLSRSDLLHRVQDQTGTTERTFPPVVEAYRRLWRQYN